MIIHKKKVHILYDSTELIVQSRQIHTERKQFSGCGMYFALELDSVSSTIEAFSFHFYSGPKIKLKTQKTQKTTTTTITTLKSQSSTSVISFIDSPHWLFPGASTCLSSQGFWLDIALPFLNRPPCAFLPSDFSPSTAAGSFHLPPWHCSATFSSSWLPR